MHIELQQLKTMPTSKKLKIAIVTAVYSEGMGYAENCLSRALARRGHEVHVVASTFNVYANEAIYDQTYSEFLGPRQTPTGTREIDGYTLHRIPGKLFHGYIRMMGLMKQIDALAPDIVHSLEVASLQTWRLALGKITRNYKIFCESHQNMSVVKPYMREKNGQLFKRAVYRMTRTLPTYLATSAVEQVYPVGPDCAEVAHRFYGVPSSKITMMSLGADTDTFHPLLDESDRLDRRELRARFGYSAEDVVCVYTGRFTDQKNPLVLAKAIDQLSTSDSRYKALFVGNGVQRDAILACRNTQVVPFMTHRSLAAHYRAADIGVWPREESMSMIDAAASGLPLIVSDAMGESGRITGNGKTYRENDIQSMAETISSFADPADRQRYGDEGRRRMLGGFSWNRFADKLERDFYASLGHAKVSASAAVESGARKGG